MGEQDRDPVLSLTPPNLRGILASPPAHTAGSRSAPTAAPRHPPASARPCSTRLGSISSVSHLPQTPDPTGLLHHGPSSAPTASPPLHHRICSASPSHNALHVALGPFPNSHRCDFISPPTPTCGGETCQGPEFLCHSQHKAPLSPPHLGDIAAAPPALPMPLTPNPHSPVPGAPHSRPAARAPWQLPPSPSASPDAPQAGAFAAQLLELGTSLSVLKGGHGPVPVCKLPASLAKAGCNGRLVQIKTKGSGG